MKTLNSVLSQFLKRELFFEIPEAVSLGRCFGTSEKRLSKGAVIQQIINGLKEMNVNEEELVLLLELKYCIMHSGKRWWKAIEIKNVKRHFSGNISEISFSRRVLKCLKTSRHFWAVKSLFHIDAMWSILSLKHEVYVKNIFFVTYPKFPVVFHTYTDRCHEESFHNSLVQLYDGTSVETLDLQSKNIETLVLASSIKLNLEPPHPVSREEREDSVEDEFPPNICLLDEAEENRKRKYIEEAFNSFKQPPLEALKYDIKSEFFGSDSTAPASCRVVFIGDNVLEGLRGLTSSGIAEAPLPDHLTPAFVKRKGTTIRMKAKYPSS